jgi:hypothetical protein
MTREDHLLLLQECGFGSLMDHPIMTENMMRFAALVAAHEREACAKLAGPHLAGRIAAAIRARGKT